MIPLLFTPVKALLMRIVSLIMRYPHQCCLWWGKDLTLIYNSPYAETMHKHPDLFGSSGPVAWQGAFLF